MKKLLTAFLVTGMILAISSLTQAQTITGFWDLGGGSWSEIPVGGQPGSKLNANDDVWSMGGMILLTREIAPPPNMDPNVFESTYDDSAGGNLFFADDPTRWGTGGSATNVFLTTIIDQNTTSLTFEFTATGFLNGLPIELTGDGSGTAFPNGPYFGTIDSTYMQVAHSPIPATIWLLGGGLIGLASFRRKFKKN